MAWLSKESRFWRDVLLILAGILLAVGAVVLVWTAADQTLARAISASDPSGPAISGPAHAGEKLGYILGGALAFAGAVCGCWALLGSQPEKPDSSYNRYLVGTGYALALLALLNFTALIGFQACGQLGQILAEDFSKPVSDDAIRRTVYLALLPGFAVLGALFFHANALRAKRDSLDEDAPELVASEQVKTKEQVVAGGLKPQESPAAAPGAAPANAAAPQPVAGKTAAEPAPPVPAALPVSGAAAVATKSVTVTKTGKPDPTPREPFCAPRFWAGLWFRIGEALLFALIAFLIVKSPSLKTWAGTTLLLVSLLLGMFVKSGESLIAGLAFRVFNAIQELVKT